MRKSLLRPEFAKFPVKFPVSREFGVQKSSQEGLGGRRHLPGATNTGRTTGAFPAFMTPYRGIGANIALKDAVRLRDALAAVDRGERKLIDAIRLSADG